MSDPEEKEIAEIVAAVDPAEVKESATTKAMYATIIEEIFFNHYKPGAMEFGFAREEIEEVAEKLYAAKRTKRKKPKNLGDVVYSFRHRRKLPQRILDTQRGSRAWLILGEGDAKYKFRLNKLTHLLPTPGLKVVPIPDATPEIIVKYALNDEQALLGKIRYNRLVDTFLGITAYSLQNHLRTKIPNYGQIEIDELYTGVDREGRHYVVPVQAKGPKDTLGVIQTIQDVTYCQTPPEKRGGTRGKKERTDFSRLKCRPVSAQLVKDGRDEFIVMFELSFDGNEVEIVDQRRYQLVPAEDADPAPGG